MGSDGQECPESILFRGNTGVVKLSCFVPLVVWNPSLQWYELQMIEGRDSRPLENEQVYLAKTVTFQYLCISH